MPHELPTPESLGLPWKEVLDGTVEDANGNMVIDETAYPDAGQKKFIVHATANFHPMLAALREAAEISTTCWCGHDEWVDKKCSACQIHDAVENAEKLG